MRLHVPLLLALWSVPLAGCMTTSTELRPEPQAKVTDTSCSWVPKLTFSTKDTPETKRQIIEYEKARSKNCPVLYTK